ncbi:MAG TPA: class I SAM-dependent methyltransferase [Candidatus Acidoferrales bacterium]|nr:class I SAM-dependent methyltransferase [Candidatus Acidoferrales bacterium]
MGSPAPTLEGYREILELLARDPRIAPHSPDWIRDGILAGGEKVEILGYILQNAPANGQSPRILDIGAQIASFALYAAKLGCRVSALDYPGFVNIYGKIAAEHGVDYRECDLAAGPLPFANDSFDFVTYTDVIEHHAFSPRRVLREIHRVLAPGGCVIILTPNQASLYNRLLLLSGRSVYGDFDHFFEAAADESVYPGHHHEFTRAELRSSARISKCANAARSRRIWLRCDISAACIPLAQGAPACAARKWSACSGASGRRCACPSAACFGRSVKNCRNSGYPITAGRRSTHSSQLPLHTFPFAI